MADVKKSTPKPKAAKKAKGPKFSARLVNESGGVIKVRTAFKFHSSSYEAAAFLYPAGDTAPNGKGSRAENDLIDSAVRPTYADAEAAAKEFVAAAIEKGYTPQEKSGKRTAIGWAAVA